MNVLTHRGMLYWGGLMTEQLTSYSYSQCCFPTFLIVKYENGNIQETLP